MATQSFHMEGNEHAVFLIHGLASSPLEMRYLATSLNRMGFTVSVPALPRYGHGSAKEGCGQWNEWIEIVQTHFRTLEGRYETVCVAGLSMGATLALAMAARERTMTALALLSLTLHYDGWVVPWYRFLFTPAYYTPLRNIYKFHEGEPYGLKNVQLRKRVAQAMAASEFSDIGPSTLSMEQLHQARQLASYAEEHAKRVRTDLLVVHAIDDETASPKAVDFAMTQISSPNKRKILLDNSYHIVTMDNERELVARETGLFFQEAIRRKHATGMTQGPEMVNAQLAMAKRLAELGN